jgi:hypothetical protein
MPGPRKVRWADQAGGAEQAREKSKSKGKGGKKPPWMKKK